jgi:hypothetical protein
MRRAFAVAMLLGVLPLAACGGSSSSSGGDHGTLTQSTSPPSPPSSAPPAAFTGVDAENYRINYASCGAFSLRSLGRQFHVRPEPDAVATAAAAGYRPGYRQAVYEGCLDALLKRPAKVKGAP